jgi:hypothetical protein
MSLRPSPPLFLLTPWNSDQSTSAKDITHALAKIDPNLVGPASKDLKFETDKHDSISKILKSNIN